jgi:putative ABC transport system permease protein
METVLSDLRNAARSLARAPAFAAIAVLALALGIAANTAIFSAVDALLLRPLPFPEPQRLVHLGDGPREGDRGEEVFSEPDLRDLREQAKSFAAVAGFSTDGFTVTGEGGAEAVRGISASADLLPMLGVHSLLGRVFAREDEGPKSARVALISAALWKRRFGGDPQTVGRSIIVDGRPSTIVGVLPEGFRFPLDGEPVQVWLPLGQGTLDGNAWDQRGGHFLDGIGRLAKGVSLTQAQAEVDRLWASLAERFPNTNKNRWLRVAAYSEQLTGAMRPALLLLMGAVALVLLIACGNVGNLMLARAAARQRELAVRAALGASRSRILRQLLSESLLLGILGGAFGLLLAGWGIEGVRALAPPELQRIKQLHIDGVVLAFTAGVSVLTPVVFGLAPALLASRPALHETLQQGGRGAAGGSHARLRGTLIVAEIALSLLLLIGAGLLGRSFVRVLQRDPGFAPDGVLTASLALPKGRFDGGPAKHDLATRLVERLQAMPGAESAAVASTLPFNGDHINLDFHIVGRPPALPGEDTVARVYMASPSYFPTLRIPVRQGRLFDDAEAAQGTSVALVSEAFARTYFPGEDAVGQRITVNGKGGAERTIVGVVGNVRDATLEKDAPPTIYLFARNSGFDSLSVAVRFRSGAMSNAAALRSEIAAVDKDLAPDAVKPLAALVSDALAARRFSLTLLFAFAATALLLAAVGLYGVMSYAVSQRTRELGIRMALGAAPRDVLFLVLGQGLRLCAIGIVIGAVAALGSTRAISGLVFGVSATDPLTFVLLSAAVAAVSLFAAFLPARRAVRVDPAIALGAE